MSAQNFTQLLFRNPHLLASENPLFVNFPDENVIEHYLSLMPNAKPSFYTSNYALFQQLKSKNHAGLHLDFSANYSNETSNETSNENAHDLVIIAFPKSKAELSFTLAMLASSIIDQSPILVIGENKSGIKSLVKLTTETITHCKKVDAARHCLLFAGVFNRPSKPFILDDWFTYYTVDVEHNLPLKVAALPGVFSQKNLDIGTKLLLAHLPETADKKVLDFGCGAGVIACVIGKKYPQASLTLVDVSALALASAEKTLTSNNLTGQYLASNSLSDIKEQYHHIVSNPPFHQGIKTHYQATESFLSGIKHHMDNGADITIVANSFLKYQPIMQSCIGKTQVLNREQGFTIYRAYK